MDLEQSDLIIPTKDKRRIFMRSVYDWAHQSKDPRTRIGAVLVRDDIPIGAGYNNFPRKVRDLESRYNDREFKNQVIVHAEMNAILNAASLGNATKGATLYTQGIPCCRCMSSIVNARISKIICHTQWPNLTYSEAWVKSVDYSKIMLEETGIELEWFDGELNVVGLLDGKTIVL